MDENRRADFSRLFQNTVVRTVINMKRRAVVGHEDLNIGYAFFRKFIDFIKDAVHQIGDHGMEGKIHAGFVLARTLIR